MAQSDCLLPDDGEEESLPAPAPDEAEVTMTAIQAMPAVAPTIATDAVAAAATAAVVFVCVVEFVVVSCVEFVFASSVALG